MDLCIAICMGLPVGGGIGLVVTFGMSVGVEVELSLMAQSEF